MSEYKRTKTKKITTEERIAQSESRAITAESEELLVCDWYQAARTIKE